MSKTKVWIRGKKTPVTLTDHDFVAEGGEGKVFIKDKHAFKIHTGKMIPEGKIRKLQTLDHPSIIKPEQMLLNAKGKPIGYTMSRVDNAIPFSRLFTNDFRNKIGFDVKKTTKLVGNLKEGFEFVHSNDCLIVDANENNFLSTESNPTFPYFIDVCSYQVPGYPATAIAANIRDPLTKDFNELTDWFSFAILACQLFVGIHPYRGKHPDFKKNDIEGRMKDGVSIFNKKTTLPSAVRDFSNIPDSYRDWFEAIFEHGERMPPPDSMLAKFRPVVAKETIVKGNDIFDIELVKEFNHDVIGYWYYNGNTVVKFASDHYEINRIERKFNLDGNQDIIFTSKTAKPFLVNYKQDAIEYIDYGSNEVNSLPLVNYQNFVAGEIVVSVSDNKLNALQIKEIGIKPQLLTMKQWDVLPHATTAYSGFLYSSILGKPYLIVFDEEKLATHYIDTEELNGYKIVEGRYQNHILILVAEKDNQYDRFVIKFSDDFSNHTTRIDKDVETADINFTVLDNGIVAFIPHDEELEIFSNNFKSNSVKKVQNKEIKSTMRLCNNGINVMFFTEKKVYKLSMK